jgi:uncharacterized protein YggU (UPF0235/DUF167 family)
MGPGARLTIRLTPRGGRDRVEGVRDGVLLARVAAPPVDDAANQALLRLLAAELGFPRSSLRLVAGATGRQKVVIVDGDLAAEAALARWPGVAVG